MLSALRAREASGTPIRVALVGAGAMGVGIAWQVGRTPGMRLVSVTDLSLEAARKAAEACGGASTVVIPGSRAPREGTIALTQSPFPLFDRPDFGFDVLVEATNTHGFAARVCLAAIERGAHVVLMNAEVDLALGPLLNARADARGVVVTSDAGDQHGVLMRMIDEIEMWSFRVVMAGNIKGFLDRYATAESLREEARIRNLNPIQCCAYTDGTKLNVEMALVANATGLVPWVTGMEGPRLARVEQVFEAFDFAKYGPAGVVDYILGAEPGGGVFVVAHCDDPLQMQYLRYYKLGGGPFYLFYRPYHLCHLETTRAITLAALYGRPVMGPTHGRVADVYAFAKRDIAAGEPLHHGMGGDQAYGLIEKCDAADPAGMMPITLLEAEDGQLPRFTRALGRDEPIGYADVDLPETFLVREFREQTHLLDGAGLVAGVANARRGSAGAFG